jgi:DNA-binding transcriptional LysR family regulator
MDLRQLAALVAVADAGSFSAAARALHTVQSNVSTHIARLERELGSTLVDRSSGSLTEEGQAVVARARHVLGELDAIAADVAALRDEVTGNVRLGCIGTVGRWLVPLVLEELAVRHPLVRAVVLDATTTSLVPQLLADRLDLAVVSLPLPDPEVRTEALFDEDRLVIAPSTHPLAGFDRVSLAELVRHDLIVEPPRDGVPGRARPGDRQGGAHPVTQGRGRRPAPHHQPGLRGLRRRRRPRHRRTPVAPGRLAAGGRRRSAPAQRRPGPPAARPAVGAGPGGRGHRGRRGPPRGNELPGVHPVAGT